MARKLKITTPEQQVVEWLKKEKWYPINKPNEIEMYTSELLNKILEDIIERFTKEFIKK